MLRIHRPANEPQSYRDQVMAEVQAIYDSEVRTSDVSSETLRGYAAWLEDHGHPQIAATCLRRAAKRQPKDAINWTDLGNLHLRCGELDEALACHLRAIVVSRPSARVYASLGRTLFRLRQLSCAQLALEEAISLHEECGQLRGELGDILLAHGRAVAAMECYQRQIELAPSSADGYGGIGMAQLHLGDCQAAIGHLTTALKRDPTSARYVVALGQAYLRMGLREEAVCVLRAGLDRRPRGIRILEALAEALVGLERVDEAADVLVFLGEVLREHNEFRSAVDIYHRALDIRPCCLRAIGGLGRAHIALGEPEEVLRHLPAALELDPGNSAIHIDLGRALHLVGEYPKALQEIAWGESGKEREELYFEEPAWDGSSLNGRTLLVVVDQGLGDGIQFLRYVRLLVAEGGRVIVVCDPRLLSFVARMDGVKGVAFGAPLPPFDVHVSMMRLPVLLKTLPHQAPYLSVDTMLIEEWRARLALDGRPVVGLSWGGNAKHRTASIRFAPLAAFAPLAELTGIRFVSLQLGLQSVELLAPPDGLQIEIVQDRSCTLADTAALIANLDIVISVDTMIAHLAGALGARIWVLLCRAPAWTFGIRGDTTPWYPTMRLFRQCDDRGWMPVLQQVRDALRERVGASDVARLDLRS